MDNDAPCSKTKTPVVLEVCISRQRGTKKYRIPEGVLIENHGIEGDAHAGADTHRQVSLLGIESINKMKELGLDPQPGMFAENIITRGLDLVSLKPGSRISLGPRTVLEITQIGKQCHTGCEISTLVGKCIMPEEGVFARVIRGGVVQKGDRITILTQL